MALLKNYSCSKCAGILTFDEGQEIFDCPFCGNEFNITDFHRDDYLAQAKDCLFRLRYDTAAEKYRILLSKNPCDFEALRGMVLVEGKVRSLDMLKDPANLSGCKCKAAIAKCEEAKGIAADEAEYFDKLAELFDLADRYNICAKRSGYSTESAKNSFKYVADSEKQYYEDSKWTSRWEKYGNYSLMGAIPIIVIFIVRLAADGWKDLVPFMIYGGLFGLLVVGITLVIKAMPTRKFRNTNVTESSHIIADQYSDDLEKIGKTFQVALHDLRKLDPTVKGYTPPEASSRNTLKENPFTDIEQTVTCATCGGQLLADKEKNLYECRFCGVAYGMSLFFNNPLEKAKNALRHDDYVEADQRFSHVLMLDSHDSEALLGRILCAGKWKSVSDVKVLDKMPPLMAHNLSERTSEAQKFSRGEAKKFFDAFCEMADLLIRYEDNEQTVLKHSKMLGIVDEQADINISAADVVDGVKKKEDIEKLLEEGKIKRNNLYHEYGVYMNNLTHELKNIKMYNI